MPYHWGRFRGIAQDRGLGDLDERVLNNIYFDTCVYHQDGIDLLLEVIPTKNILFASEMIGAVWQNRTPAPIIMPMIQNAMLMVIRS